MQGFKLSFVCFLFFFFLFFLVFDFVNLFNTLKSYKLNLLIIQLICKTHRFSKQYSLSPCLLPFFLGKWTSRYYFSCHQHLLGGNILNCLYLIRFPVNIRYVNISYWIDLYSVFKKSHHLENGFLNPIYKLRGLQQFVKKGVYSKSDTCAGSFSYHMNCLLCSFHYVMEQSDLFYPTITSHSW